MSCRLCSLTATGRPSSPVCWPELQFQGGWAGLAGGQRKHSRRLALGCRPRGDSGLQPSQTRRARGLQTPRGRGQGGARVGKKGPALSDAGSEANPPSLSSLPVILSMVLPLDSSARWRRPGPPFGTWWIKGFQTFPKELGEVAFAGPVLCWLCAGLWPVAGLQTYLQGPRDVSPGPRSAPGAQSTGQKTPQVWSSLSICPRASWTQARG